MKIRETLANYYISAGTTPANFSDEMSESTDSSPHKKKMISLSSQQLMSVANLKPTPKHTLPVRSPQSPERKSRDGSANKGAKLTPRSERGISVEDERPGINPVKRTKEKKPISERDETLSGRLFDEFVEHYIEKYIPAIFLSPSIHCAKLILFYHANGEDIGQAAMFCRELNKKLDVKL